VLNGHVHMFTRSLGETLEAHEVRAAARLRILV
jgi:hypothetical protein